MRFHADLHVHSKYSRATSRDLDLEHLAQWAARKGIGVVATGDFTHPAWRAELAAKLVPPEGGLFWLRPDIEAAIAQALPAACRTPVRFMLEVEISTIYKKGERTRKVHHLIYAPDFDSVDRISARLSPPSAISPPPAGRFSGSIPAPGSRSCSRPVRTPISFPPISGRRGSRR